MNRDKHLITREIGIDAGHRVTYHGSKCRNLHGHRYTVQAVCEGPLFTEGEQRGMVLDFGFLKDEMMRHIDAPCDHGMILWCDDPILDSLCHEVEPERLKEMVEYTRLKTFCEISTWAGGPSIKIYLVPFVPTAENLARHWWQRLYSPVRQRSSDRAKLVSVKVWETPNCMAEYSL